MDEIKRQLHPVFRTIEKTEESVEELRQALNKNSQATESIGRWKLGLWSNGSGGPPGYLEVAREQDKIWKDALIKKVDALTDAHLIRTGEETGHLKWLTKWVALGGLAIAGLTLVLLFFGWLETRKIKSGDLENPFDIIQQKPVPVVYARETPLHHQAMNE